jgi:ribosomal protein S18 acetylase RimI-like enzyme
MIIRTASPDDAPSLARLLEAFNGPPVSAEQAHTRLLAIHGVETVLVAEIEGEAVGFASLRLIPYLSDDAPYAELTELYVADTHRRRGIGHALLERAEALARERGAAEIILLTGQTNETAQAFYRSLGYGEYGLAMCKRWPEP